MMRYEGSQHKPKPIADRIIDIVNFVLIIVIAFCINYMVVGFLF